MLPSAAVLDSGVHAFAEEHLHLCVLCPACGAATYKVLASASGRLHHCLLCPAAVVPCGGPTGRGC